MNKIFIIVKREFLTKVMTKGFLIGTLLGPVFMLGIMFLPAYFMNMSHDEAVTMGVVDQSGIMAPKLYSVFDDTLKNGEPRYNIHSISPEDYRANEQKYRDQIDSKALNMLLLIPADVLQGGTVTYMAKSISDIEFIQTIRQRLNSVVNKIRLEKAGIDPREIARLTTKIKLKTVKIVKGKEEEKGLGQEYIVSMVFLFILYFTLIFYGNAIMRGVLEEKTSRVIEILLSSTNSFKLMLGKLLGVGSVGLVQYMFWALMGFAGFMFAASQIPDAFQNVSFSPTIFIFFIIFFILGFFEFATLFAAVGAMCSSQDDVQALGTPVTMMIVIPFMISFMVIRDPTSSLAQILSLIPFLTPMLMFLRISLVMPPVWEIAVALLLNIAAILLFTWISAKIFRVGILMHGKRPTVPEIFRWLKYK